MEIILASLIFLLLISAVLWSQGAQWSNTLNNFLFANRSLQHVSASMAITSHWFWAIAIFVGPAVAYNWGWQGLLWFAIPNGLSCWVVGWLASRVRNRYPQGYSLTEYVRDNFSARISLLFQLQFVLISLAALLLGFTAVNKLWAFAELSSYIQPIYASLAIGVITLAFTLRGGIRTSVFTGAVQTVLWLIFLAGTSVMLFNQEWSWFAQGKNNLASIADENFITKFAVAFLISILVGATSHGMMWQKAFSMPRENIKPTFYTAGVIFAVIVIALGSLGLYAQSVNLTVLAADTSAMAGMLHLGGWALVAVFAVILIGQTSTVMDSSLNYISSLITREWIKQDSVWISRIIMTAFVTLAWMISWLKLEIWTILMLMSAVRIVMFVPLVLEILSQKFRESWVFYSSIIAISLSVYLAWTARTLKMPIYDMFSALTALAIPLSVYLLTVTINKLKE
jgi:urea-proton symporter